MRPGSARDDRRLCSLPNQALCSMGRKRTLPLPRSAEIRGANIMDRRTFLKTTVGASAVAAAGGVATPAISQRAAARALRLVPHADLSNFDPIWSNAYIARNAGILVGDTLYGVDAKLQPQRQMVEAEQVSEDGLIWTFRLRPGLKFHDGEPVRAKDAVASISLAGCPATGQGRALAQPPENRTVGTGPFTMVRPIWHSAHASSVGRYRLRLRSREGSLGATRERECQLRQK